MRSDEYCVRCDQCQGRRYVNGQLCPKCDGDGTILIRDIDETFSQRAAREASLIMLVGVFVAGIIIAALHYFKVF